MFDKRNLSSFKIFNNGDDIYELVPIFKYSGAYISLKTSLNILNIYIPLVLIFNDGGAYTSLDISRNILKEDKFLYQTHCDITIENSTGNW